MKSMYQNIPKYDFHAHCFPKAYREAIQTYFGGENPDQFPFPDWSMEKHQQFAKKLNIEFSLLSISSPHVNFGTKQINKTIIRNSNEEMMESIRDKRKHFGYLASLPVPDIDSTLIEITYCDEILNVDGFTLPTNVKDFYMSDEKMVPVFEELNRRGSLVTFHPNRPWNERNCAEGIPYPVMEFFFNTTRVIADMLHKNYMGRFPDIKWLIPHAGSLLPVIVERMTGFRELLQKSAPKGDSALYFERMAMCYFDLSGDCAEYQLDNLMKMVSAEHIFYGTDFPFTEEGGIIKAGDKLWRKETLSESQKNLLFYENGKRWTKELLNR